MYSLSYEYVPLQNDNQDKIHTKRYIQYHLTQEFPFTC